MLLNWALNPDGDDEGGFSHRMTDIRRRLLNVLGMGEDTAEVRFVDVSTVTIPAAGTHAKVSARASLRRM